MLTLNYKIKHLYIVTVIQRGQHFSCQLFISSVTAVYFAADKHYVNF